MYIAVAQQRLYEVAVATRTLRSFKTGDRKGIQDTAGSSNPLSGVSRYCTVLAETEPAARRS
jgi:hypothetical protein